MSFDTDRDGYISHDEAQRMRHFDRALVDADDNRDGRLDRDEFIKAQSIHERLQAGQYVVDSVITARVKAALLKEPRLSGSEIEVETHEGIVQLSGLVDNNEQVKRAAEIAAGVEGVTAVRNHLLVKKLGDMKQSAEPGDQT
jgi:hyperosmotically inducible protein